MAYIKHNTAVSVTVNGRYLGIWQTKEGEEVEVDTQKIFPGAGRPQVAIGSVRTVADVTVSKTYDDELRGLRLWLVKSTGKPALVATQQLDADGNPVGAAAVVSGLLGNIQFPDAEAGSNDAQMIEIEIHASGDLV